jgi:chromosome segregation ATPase
MTHTDSQPNGTAHKTRITEIKFDFSHDVDRMAQAIADLRNLVDEKDAYTAKARNEYQTTVANLQESRGDALREIDAKNATINGMQDEINSAREEIKHCNMVIENQQEALNELRNEMTQITSDLTDQCKHTAQAALQVAEARRSEAQVEREYRNYIQERTKEFELLQTELRNLDKLRKELSTYRNECRKLIDENTQLQLQAERRWIFRRPKAYVSRAMSFFRRNEE